MSKKITTLVSAVAILFSLGTGTVTSAEEVSTAFEVDYSEIINEQAYLASPQELREAGISESEIQKQQAAIDALPAVVKNKNDAFSNQQKNLIADSKQRDKSKSSSLKNKIGATVSAYTCYGVRNSSNVVSRFCHTGNQSVHVANALELSPGSGSGRSLYQPKSGGTQAYYWTPMRGHTNSWFRMPQESFFGTPQYPTILRIERYTL